MQLNIRIDGLREAQRALNFQRGGTFERAAASALNKVIDQAKTAMVREITSEFMVSAGYVRERLRVKRASARGELAAELIGGDGRRRAANVIAFVERKVTLAQARKRLKAGNVRQLFVKIKRTGGYKPLGPKAFIANKGRTVFERVGRERLPIKPVQTIDVPAMFNTRRINQAVTRFIEGKLPALLANEVRFFAGRQG